jgi:hypothetical protein
MGDGVWIIAFFTAALRSPEDSTHVCLDSVVENGVVKVCPSFRLCTASFLAC